MHRCCTLYTIYLLSILYILLFRSLRNSLEDEDDNLSSLDGQNKSPAPSRRRRTRSVTDETPESSNCASGKSNWFAQDEESKVSSKF